MVRLLTFIGRKYLRTKHKKDTNVRRAFKIYKPPSK